MQMSWKVYLTLVSTSDSSGRGYFYACEDASKDGSEVYLNDCLAILNGKKEGHKMDYIELINTEAKKQKVTHRELAQKAGYTEVTISRWLNRKREPRFADVIKIFNVLGIELLVYHRGIDISYDAVGFNPYQE